MKRKEQINRQCIKYKLCILLVFFTFFSCTQEDKDVKIIKKVSGEYVKAFSGEIKDALEYFKENSMAVIVEELGKKDSLVLSYPDYSIYVCFYTNAIDRRLKRSYLLSRLFYVDGYPVALYTDRLPAMKESNIPKKVYRKVKGDILVDDGNTWYLVICKRTHKYKVLPDPYLEPDSIIFKRGLKDFSCD